jgi:Cof subfamily protein (haloacid dehalogenase superfamily)
MSNDLRRISLVLSDVDGTLVTKQKDITDRTKEAVRSLKAAGIAFAVTSSRPPAGLASVVETLGITTPVAGFNGGMIVDQAGTILRQWVLPADTARDAIAYLRQAGVDVWAFHGNEWLVTNPDGGYVAHETHTLGYGPVVVTTFDPYLDGIHKIVGASDDSHALQTAESALIARFGDQAAISMSQIYYLDITHQSANKGNAVLALSEILLIPPDEIVTIGDGENDIFMFKASGLSIAMGNASSKVKQSADSVTASNDEEGWAEAVMTQILPRAAIK